MKVMDRFEEEISYVEDRTSDEYPYPKAVSKIDESNLKKIANDLKIDYINMSKQSNINSKLNEIKQKYENNSGEDTITNYADTYYILVLPLLVLLILEFIKYKKKI